MAQSQDHRLLMPPAAQHDRREDTTAEVLRSQKLSTCVIMTLQMYSKDPLLASSPQVERVHKPGAFRHQDACMSLGAESSKSFQCFVCLAEDASHMVAGTDSALVNGHAMRMRWWIPVAKSRPRKSKVKVILDPPGLNRL